MTPGSEQGRTRPGGDLSRPVVAAVLAVGWLVFAVLVVRGWQAAAAPSAPEDVQLLPAAACGLALLLLATSWQWDRVRGRSPRPRP